MTCIVDGDGTRWWYKNCQIHCTDSPAWIRPDGAQHWFRNGQLTALTVLLRFGQMGIRHGGSMVAAEPVKSRAVTWSWDSSTQTLFVLTFGI